MLRRRRHENLPLQANFYPMAGAAFMENTDIRVSLIGRQSLGVGNLGPGKMEVVLDRRTIWDDNKGLSEVCGALCSIILLGNVMDMK